MNKIGDTVDYEDKRSINEWAPFFYRYFNLDKARNFYMLVAFRLAQAYFLTANMAHPDEYWQVTQVAYRAVYADPENGYDIDLPWEYHNDYRLRNTIYPLFHALPMYVLKTIGLDGNMAIRLCPYFVHMLLVIIGDWFLWLVGKETVGKQATQVAFIFYLTNRVQNAFIVRCFTNSIEEIITIIAFYYYQRVDEKVLNPSTALFTGLVSVQFMMRNTSPIGWIPLLFLKVLKQGAFLPFLCCAITIALPIVVSSTYLDSVYYSHRQPAFEWTFTGLNFLRINVVEGLSKYFGDHPWWFYLGAFGPAMFTVIYPAVIYGTYFYTREMLSQGRSPEIMYMTFFYVFVFSVIGHKEKRFLLPVFAFCSLAVGYLLVRRARVWKGKVTFFLYLAVIVEVLIQVFYQVNHRLWVFTDYMLAKGEQPHSFYTQKRYDQPWYSNLHTNHGNKTNII